MNVTNMTENASMICSDYQPLSAEFFRHLSSVEKTLTGLCGLIALVTVIDYIEQVSYILHRYQANMAVKYKSIEILSICPAISLVSLAALCVPRAQLVSQLASSVASQMSVSVQSLPKSNVSDQKMQVSQPSCKTRHNVPTALLMTNEKEYFTGYVPWCVYKFVSLMISYLGGTENAIGRLKESKIHMTEPPCCCCCFCLPQLAVTMKNVRVIKSLVFQNAILQPPMTFITLVLWTDEKYKKGQYSQDNAFPYLTAVNVVSSLLALYGLMVFFKLCKQHLGPVSIVPKFVALQLIILFCQLQDTIFSVLARFNIPACVGILSSEVRGQAYLQMLLVLQMFLLSLLGRYLYRRPHDILSTLSHDQNKPSSLGHNDVVKMESPIEARGLNLQTFSNEK